MNRLVIFRVHDADDGEHQFVQLRVVDDRVEEHGRIFTVGEDSSYLEMTFSQVVLANAVPDGSIDLAWYTIVNDQTLESPVIHELPGDELFDALHGLLAEYDTRRSEVLH